MRRSHHIRRQQATNVKPAIRLAEKNGTPLNRFVTLNFTHTDCDEEAVSLAFGELRERFMRWYRRAVKKQRRPTPAAFIWVIENTNDHIAGHWLIHIPPKHLAAFRERLPLWMEKATGGNHAASSAINVKPAKTPFGAGKYMLKGIDPVFALLYGIRDIPQGEVIGKRFGFSQNLGPTSCRRERTYYSQIRQDRARQAA